MKWFQNSLFQRNLKIAIVQKGILVYFNNICQVGENGITLKNSGYEKTRIVYGLPNLFMYKEMSIVCLRTCVCLCYSPVSLFCPNSIFRTGFRAHYTICDGSRDLKRFLLFQTKFRATLLLYCEKKTDLILTQWDSLLPSHITKIQLSLLKVKSVKVRNKCSPIKKK